MALMMITMRVVVVVMIIMKVVARMILCYGHGDYGHVQLAKNLTT